MGKLGPTLTKICEANFIEFSYFSHEFLLEYENKFEENFLHPLLHLTDAFEFGTFVGAYGILISASVTLTGLKCVGFSFKMRN